MIYNTLQYIERKLAQHTPVIFGLFLDGMENNVFNVFNV